jgi:hypothetical protein
VTWLTVSAPSNLVQHQAGSAVLIKMPGSEFRFWHPAKLVRFSGKNGYRMTFSFTEEFKFKLFRPGKGKHNRHEKIEEKTMTADAIMGAFGGQNSGE